MTFVLCATALKQRGAKRRSGSLEQASWPQVQDGMERAEVKVTETAGRQLLDSCES